jgi:hypothetical protein
MRVSEAKLHKVHPEMPSVKLIFGTETVALRLRFVGNGLLAV